VEEEKRFRVKWGGLYVFDWRPRFSFTVDPDAALIFNKDPRELFWAKKLLCQIHLMGMEVEVLETDFYGRWIVTDTQDLSF
jgi:hypothetical protein